MFLSVTTPALPSPHVTRFSEPVPVIKTLFTSSVRGNIFLSFFNRTMPSAAASYAALSVNFISSEADENLLLYLSFFSSIYSVSFRMFRTDSLRGSGDTIPSFIAVTSPPKSSEGPGMERLFPAFKAEHEFFTAPQSETVIPSNFQSSRSFSLRSQLFSVQGIPFILLYALITVFTLPFSTQALKPGRYISSSALSDTFTSMPTLFVS